MSNKLLFSNYRLLASRMFTLPLSSLDSDLPESILREFSIIVDNFCSSLKGERQDDVDFGLLSHQLRSNMLAKLTHDVAAHATSVPDFELFLGEFLSSITISCTYTPELECLNVIIDVLPKVALEDPFAQYLNFVTEQQLNTIH